MSEVEWFNSQAKKRAGLHVLFNDFVLYTVSVTEEHGEPVFWVGQERFDEEFRAMDEAMVLNARQANQADDMIDLYDGGPVEVSTLVKQDSGFVKLVPLYSSRDFAAAHSIFEDNAKKLSQQYSEESDEYNTVKQKSGYKDFMFFEWRVFSLFFDAAYQKQKELAENLGILPALEMVFHMVDYCAVGEEAKNQMMESIGRSCCGRNNES